MSFLLTGGQALVSIRKSRSHEGRLINMGLYLRNTRDYTREGTSSSIGLALKLGDRC
jgi:hypothetical protein